MKIIHIFRKIASTQLDTRAWYLRKNKNIRYQKYLIRDRCWVVSSETTWGCNPSPDSRKTGTISP